MMMAFKKDLLIMKIYIAVLLMSTGCVSASNNNCNSIYYIDSIGGCDSGGFCGVTARSTLTRQRIKTIKQYPVILDSICMGN